MEGLIEIKQLPIIEQHLKKVSEEIDVKVKQAKSLICTEENKQSIKKIRTEMNKELQDFEAQRKAIKEKVLAPYMQFESIYKECVSDKYKVADKELKEKIESIEIEQKKKLEEQARIDFEQYLNEKGIDIVTYEKMNLKIGLSDTPTKLKKQIVAYIDKISDDLSLIETQLYKDEILVEYKKDLNVSRAIREVQQRKEQLKQIEEQRVNENLEKEKQQLQNNLQQLQNSTVEKQEEYQEKIYTITFKVTGTAPKLKELKDFLLRGGYQYE